MAEGTWKGKYHEGKYPEGKSYKGKYHEGKSYGLPILGIVAIVAVVGLVWLFAQKTGVAPVSTEEGQAVVGEAMKVGSKITPVPVETNCKIIGVTGYDYQWISGSGLTASQVCAKEKLKCKGVGRTILLSYLDNGRKVQMGDHEYHLLSSNFCGDKMGEILYNEESDYSSTDYSEPYAGPVRITVMNEAVLCCN